MRRKSTRASGKQSPDKGKQSDTPVKKSRRTSRRRRKSTSDSENSEDEDVKQLSETETTSKINTRHTSPDIENNDNIIEKASDTPEGTMEKQEKKIKLKRSRFSSANDGNEANSEEKYSSRRSRRRGSPTVEERTPPEDEDDKKGKGKSKGKTKSKIEKSQPLNESETHNESEISTNAQVTAQSPQIVNTNLADNVVDVAESTEDIKTEIDVKEEGHADEETPDKSIINDEQDASTDQSDVKNDKLTLENGNNCNVCSETQALPEIKNQQGTEHDDSQSNNAQSAIISETNQLDEVTVHEPTSAKEENKEEAVVIETVQNEASEEVVKSDEDFVGFTTDQTEKKQTEFVEEPMDISMDVTFTIKTDESSINITEAEETNEDNNVHNVTEACDDSNKLKNIEKSEAKPSVNRKITLSRDSSSRPAVSRQKGWGSSTIGLDLFTLIPIDTTVIQNIYTNVEFLDESEVKLDLETKDRRKSVPEVKERKRLERSVSSSDSDYRKYDSKSEEKEQEDNANIIAMNRKISIVDDSASKLKPPPSPARNPLSNVLFITNLVRPFTLKQLKELLERTGRIKENGFWTDRIKSKCYVQYEKVEDAEATRNALHGVHWPIGNGKKLIIDYASADDLDNAKNPPATPPIPPEGVKIEKETEEPPKRERDEEEERLRDRIKEKRRHEHVREWDVGKAEVHRGRTRSRERDRTDKRRHSRHSPSPFDDFITRKQKKVDEQVPQKLMDDLFQKTKTTPSIYWQPLTPEEIATKQQQRLERMAEHKRRLEESTRGRAEFGRGGPYRRRYD